MCNGAGKAVGMRFDLRSNGVGDQVDQSFVEVRIDRSVEIVFILVCRYALGRVDKMTDVETATSSQCLENVPILSRFKCVISSSFQYLSHEIKGPV